MPVIEPPIAIVTDAPLRSRAWHELHVVNGDDDAQVENVCELSDNVRLTLPPHPMVVKPLCRTSCVGTDNVELAALTADLFRALAFVGMGSLEVKYDLDGRPWITEPTVGRPNLQSYSAFAQHVLKVHRVSGAYGSRWDPVPLIGLIWSSARNAWTALPKT